MTTSEQTFAATAEPNASELAREYATYYRSVTDTVSKFRESFKAAYGVNGSRTSRRQVYVELSSTLHGLGCIYPVPEPSEMWDLKFSKTNWNSKARLQAVCEGLAIVAEMLRCVVDDRENSSVSPVEIHGRIVAVKRILATLLALIDDL